MNRKATQKLVPIAGGGTATINVDSSIGYVHILPAAAITLSSSYSITATGTPKDSTEIEFIYGGNITQSAATGITVSIFGTALTDSQALYEARVRCFYNGTAWQVHICIDHESGNVAIDGGGLVTGSVTAPAIAARAISLDKTALITRGSIAVGGVSDVPTSLDCKTTGQLLIGDGVDINSVRMSGDTTINSAGVVTVGNGKITNAMLATPPLTYYVLSRTFSATEILGMYTTPISIINAPGTGKVIKPVMGMLWLDYTTTTYAGGGQIELRFGSDIIATSPVGSITSATDILGSIQDVATATTTSLNQALLISNATAAFTTGDSPVRLILYYAIEDFTF